MDDGRQGLSRRHKGTEKSENEVVRVFSFLSRAALAAGVFSIVAEVVRLRSGSVNKKEQKRGGAQRWIQVIESKSLQCAGGTILESSTRSCSLSGLHEDAQTRQLRPLPLHLSVSPCLRENPSY